MHIPPGLWALTALILFGTAIAVARRQFPVVVRLGAWFEVSLLAALFVPFMGAMYMACQGISESAVSAQLLWLLTVMVCVFVAISFVRTPRTIPLFAYTLGFLLSGLAMSGSVLAATMSWSGPVNVLGAF